MNEKIKLLAEQAKASVPAGLLVNEWIERYNEIFAELIVQECIGKVTKVSDSIKEFDPDNADGIDLCDLITYHIKKHFGVEDERTN